MQATVIDILMNKLRRAAKDLGIKEVAVAGGVSANSGLRDAFLDHAKRFGWKVHIPKFSFTTDNAAMVTEIEKFAGAIFVTVIFTEPCPEAFGRRGVFTMTSS